MLRYGTQCCASVELEPCPCADCRDSGDRIAYANVRTNGYALEPIYRTGHEGIFYLLKHVKTLHIKVELGLTKEQYEKDLPNEKFETDIPMPTLPNMHDGFIEFHFLPHQRVEAAWVKFPTTPHIPNAR